MRSLVASLLGVASAEMYDATFPLPVAPAKCRAGCARWSDLASDGNKRSQSAVDAKWLAGKAPPGADRQCAMPSHDPSSTYWCYCRDSHDTSWGYCSSPTTPHPEQLNLQHARPEVAVASFVTFGEDSGADPMAEWSRSESFENSTKADGITHQYRTTTGRQYFMHFVKLVALQPRARYYYRVKSGSSAWSSTYSFTALYAGSEDGLPTKLAIFGDMGVYDYNNMGNLERDSEAGRIDSIIHLGDHAYNIAKNDGARGDGYLNAFQRLLARLPWVPVLGNHEYYDGDEFHRYLNQTYGEVYGHEVVAPALHHGATPLNFLVSRAASLGAAVHGATHPNAPPSHTARFYSVDVGLIHFVALDLNVYYFSSEGVWAAPQLRWLAKDLAAAHANRHKVPWILVGSHYPIYCTSSTLAAGLHDDGQGEDGSEDSQDCWSYQGEIQRVRDDLEPLFARYGVDAYFAGHEHNYESTWPMMNSTVLSHSFIDPPGPVHFTTGAGGAPSLDKFGTVAEFTRRRLSAWGYGRLTVTNASYLRYDHILNSNDSVYDTVEIRKSVHAPYAAPPLRATSPTRAARR